MNKRNQKQKHTKNQKHKHEHNKETMKETYTQYKNIDRNRNTLRN